MVSVIKNSICWEGNMWISERVLSFSYDVMTLMYIAFQLEFNLKTEHVPEIICGAANEYAK